MPLWYSPQKLVALLFICSVVYNSVLFHGFQDTRLYCLSPSPGACSNSCPLSQWCHPAISSSVAHFTSCPQFFPVSGSFPMSQLFTSGGQSIEASASASVLPMNIQDWFPSRLTGLISLQSKGLSRVSFNTTVQKHQSCSAQPSLQQNVVHRNYTTPKQLWESTRKMGRNSKKYLVSTLQIY